MLANKREQYQQRKASLDNKDEQLMRHVLVGVKNQFFVGDHLILKNLLAIFFSRKSYHS